MLRDPWLELRSEMGWREEEEGAFEVEEREIGREGRCEKANTEEEEKHEEPNVVNNVGDLLPFGCPRCTRHHPGPPDECRSCDKACRRCGVVGHFQEVHDVTNKTFREIIVQSIHQDLWL